VYQSSASSMAPQSLVRPMAPLLSDALWASSLAPQSLVRPMAPQSLVRLLAPLLLGALWVTLRAKLLVAHLDLYLDSDLVPLKGSLTEFSMEFVKVGQLGPHSDYLLMACSLESRKVIR